MAKFAHTYITIPTKFHKLTHEIRFPTKLDFVIKCGIINSGVGNAFSKFGEFFEKLGKFLAKI
jgi:hypothetical protein